MSSNISTNIFDFVNLISFSEPVFKLLKINSTTSDERDGRCFIHLKV